MVDGAINGAIFRGWVEQQLVPTLKPGDIVVLDNLSSHKSPSIRAATERVGASVRYLPAYSPDLYPIETVFSKLKTLVRKAGRRTLATLWRLCGQFCSRFKEAEAATTSETAATAMLNLDAI